MNKVSPARAAAFEILLKIARDRAFSSSLLPVYEEKLAAKDRSLCHQLTLGVLRKQIYLDRVVQSLSRTRIEKLDREVLIALRLGLYQLLFLDRIPAFSAINESVNLVHAAKKRSATGLANAILRRAAREKNFKFDYADDIERVSVETSHPRWLIERWTRSFGFKETENLARANNETPRLAFRLTAKSDERTEENLRKLNLEIVESEIAKNAFLVEKSNEMLLAFAESGKIYFQEESSQLVGETVNLQTGEKFLDVCAAPGGKFTQIQNSRRKVFDEIENSGNAPKGFKSETFESETVNPKCVSFAGDFHEHRLRFLLASAAKQGLSNVNLIAYDAENALPFEDETFDCILLDAPCSGTGTIRHNPEIRYFLSEEDFLELQAKQLKILRSASKTLKPGGSIVYSTCSLETEENEAVVGKFLEAENGFERMPLEISKRFLTADGFARTVPSRDATDGFFIAVLRKK